MPRVAFQGERGAYGEDAIQLRWRGNVFPMASWTFDDVIRAVLTGKADYGVIPVENTIVGKIDVARSALDTALERAREGTNDAEVSGHTLVIVDEVSVEVRHALLAPPGATLESITIVASHPVALAQCGRFLAAHPHIATRESYDTAGAAREVAAHASPYEAAIAGLSAARRYNLHVIETDIQDVPQNQTRFAIIQRVPQRTTQRVSEPMMSLTTSAASRRRW